MVQPGFLVRTVYQRIVGITEAVFTRLANRRHWLLAATAAALALSLFVSFPRVSLLTGKDAMYTKDFSDTGTFWPIIEEQSRNPLSRDLQLYRYPTWHVGKLAFRLTQPIAARFLNVGRNGLLVLQMTLGVIMLTCAGLLVERLYRDRVTSVAIVFALSSIFAGKAAFLQLTGTGDGYAFAAFVIAACLRPPPAIFAAIIVACFTDERAALAAPLLAVFWAIADAREDGRPAWFSVRPLSVVAALACYAAARLYLQHRYGMHTPLGEEFGFDRRAMVIRNLNRLYPVGLGALSGLWLMVIAAAWYTVRARRWDVFAAAFVLSAAVVATAMVPFDFYRGMAYLLPLVLVALAAGARYGLAVRDARELAIIAFLVSFLTSLSPIVARESSASPMPVEIARLIYVLAR